MKILCPVDFSDHSKKALHYAIDLSNKINAKLHIVSAFPIIDNANSLTNVDSILEEKYSQDMKELFNGIMPFVKTDSIPTSSIYKGSPEQVIEEYVKKHDIDLVVMGTQGINSVRTLFFGSTTKRIVKKSKVPVLAIPDKIDGELFSKNLLLALDNKILDDGRIFDFPVTLAKTLGVKIDIIHSNKEEEVIPFDPFISSYLEEHMGEVILTDKDDPVKVIKEYSESGNYGMVIMVKRTRSFISRLLLDSNSAVEVEIINIPLLVLPDHFTDKDHN